MAEISQPTILTNKQMRNNVPYILKLYFFIRHQFNKKRFEVFSKFIDSVFFYKNK